MQKNADTRTVISFTKRIAVFLLVSFFVLPLDLLTKRVFFSENYGGKPIIPGILDFVLHKNMGISFNIPIPREMILLVTFVVLLGIIVLVLRIRDLRFLSLIGLALIFGGALGNAYDRLTLSFVRDWLLLFERSAINFADTSIMIGMLLFLFNDRKVETSSNDVNYDMAQEGRT